MHFPAELLQAIFVFSVPPQPSFRATDTPMLLTHVCRAWRDVALSTPSLWSSVRVPKKVDAPKGVEALLALWFTRARNSMLDVSIQYFEDVRVEAGQLVFARLSQILHTLVPYHARVRRMEGCFAPAMAAHIRISINYMVNVEELDFTFQVPSCQSNTLSSESMLPVDLGSPQRSLRHLTITGTSTRLDLRSAIAHPLLTHLYLNSGCVCSSAAFQLLALMPTLKDVTLVIRPHNSRYTYSRPDLGAPKSDKRVELRALEALELRSSHDDVHVGDILDKIHAPNLQVLNTRGVMYALDGCDWTSLCNFLARSQAPLRHMTLFDFSKMLRRPQACLACCPQLEHLAIYCHFHRRNGLPARPLAVEGTGGKRLLPNLHTFTFHSCDSECAALARLLENRAAEALAAGSAGAMPVTISTEKCGWN